jgi:hypothetical protein
MKQCPLCNRTFADDLNFCLDDGAVLLAYHDDELTRVARSREEPPSTVPYPTAPAQRKSSKAVVVAVLGTILLVLLAGGVKLALRFAQADERASTNYSQPSPYPVSSPVPSGSVIPPCTVLNNCPTPSPSPATSLQPVASPSASPEESVTLIGIGGLRLGLYQAQYDEQLDEGGIRATRTLRIQFEFNKDGTYTGTAYASIPAVGMSETLFREERGTFTVVDDVLIMRDRREHVYDVGNDVWKPWTPIQMVNTKLRNITPTTFEMFKNSEPNWLTFTKLPS